MLVPSLKNKFSALIITHYPWQYKENLIRSGLELNGFDLFFKICTKCLLRCKNHEQMQATLITLNIFCWHYNTSPVTCRQWAASLVFVQNVCKMAWIWSFLKLTRVYSVVSGLVVTSVCDIHSTQTKQTLTYIIIISQVIRSVFISKINELVSKLINWTENSYF